MKSPLYITFALLLGMSFSACEKQDETAHKEQSPASTNTASTANTPTVAPKVEPHKAYSIADSSKVMTLEGGVKLYIVEEGNGAKPAPGSNVVINYEGRLLDGTIFDSSFEREQVADFNLNGLIRGWQVGLTQMKTGAKGLLIVPAAMGYGDRGQGKIPANSTLIFDIDLITTY